MPALKNTTFVCLDCEATGLDPEKDRIIEVAAVRFTLSETLGTFETLTDPDYPISPEAMKVHNITPYMLAGKPKIQQILPDLLAFLRQDILVGHAIGFDIDLVCNAAKRAGLPCTIKEQLTIDTLRLARHYGDSPNNSLSNLALHFNIPSEGAHRAMNDVEMNIAVFRHLISRFRTLEQIVELLAKPVRMKYMPLGKHKGRPFSEIPLQYLQWASHMDFDCDLLFSIRLELKRRKMQGGFTQTSNPFSEL